MGNVQVVAPESEGIKPFRYFQGNDDISVLGAVTDMLQRHIAEAEAERDRKRELGMDRMAEWYDGRRSYADMIYKMLYADLAARLDEMAAAAQARQ